MNETIVRFEADNFHLTMEYIRHHKIDKIDEKYRDNLEEYICGELKKLIEGDMLLWCKKDYVFFEHL